ncbi:hypothetical protein [Acetobacteroides hydrogenigenes]|uniref:Uncharacterized protein n=1 Tax=Acetobacteroides hydrogenigenes TaxID=979970 RepID=A0A4R2ENP0_9BACT|nr:hypothetical protein [Acetobacteroides hydrogenigenes]TCN70115.1 hypothetical protein CLV25_10466 [Acetobacteroides hydrogenigenes]
MKKGLLIALLALGVVVTAAAGSQHKQSSKPKYQAKADTSFNVKAESFGDFSSMEKMMEDMHKQSRNFFDNAMAMVEEMGGRDFGFPAQLDSIVKKLENDEFVDSLGNSKFHKRKGMIIPRPKMHGKQYRFRTDSLGNNESIVVLSDGKKTTIIKNGKDTTIVDGPMDSIMSDFGGDIDISRRQFMMPRFNFRGFNDEDWDVAAPRSFGNEGMASESPSVQEMEMLAKKGIIPSKQTKNSLDVENVSIRSNNRSNTYSVTFRLEDAEQCDLQVVAPDGMTLEKSTIIGSQGRFKRTVKITPNQDYVYVVIANNKKISVSKFWF